MAISFEQYQTLKQNNALTWDTDALQSTGKAVSDYLSNVQAQSRFEGQKWNRDEFQRQRGQIEDMRSRLRYLQAYANSVKDRDAAQYQQLTESQTALSQGLDEAEQWFRDNSEGFLRHKQWQAAEGVKQAAAVQNVLSDLRQGKTTVSDAAARTGMDEKSFNAQYQALRAQDKQQDRESKYGGMGFDELMGSLKNSANIQIARDVQTTLDEMKVDERQTPEQRQTTVFQNIADKYGMSQEDVRQIYESSKDVQGFSKFASAEISNEEKYDLFRRIIDSSTAEQLEKLQKTLPQAQYYSGLRDSLTEAIEDKQEDRYYLTVKEQFPNAEKAVAYVDGEDFGFKEKVNEEEKAAYLKTYAQMKQAGVDTQKFATFEQRYKERLKNKVFQTAVKGAASQNVGTAALATVLSTPVNMLGSVADVVKFAVTRAKALGGGDDWYDPKGTASYTAQNMRGAVSDMIGDDHKLAQFLYDTGTSMQDTALAIAVNYIPVAGQAISGAMFFSSAGMAAANEVIERGGSMNQATATLIANGAAELAFEEISLDKLLKAKNNVKNLKTLFSNTAKQMFTEGSEELTTSLANTMTDNWINGGNSAFQRSVRSYEAQGYSHDDAQRAAFKDWNVGILTDFLGGALSGAVFGGAAGGKAYLAARKDTNVGSLTVKAGDLAAMAGEDTREAQETAQEIVKKNGVEAVLEAAGKSENGQTRQTAQHFAELHEQGKLKEADAAALLVKAAKEQVAVNGIDAAARTMGVETLTEFREKQQKSTDLYADFDLAGNKAGSESTEVVKSSFGTAHPNGIFARDKYGKTVTVLGVESSLTEYGGDGSHTVTLRLSDGTTADAAGVQLGDAAYDRLLRLAPNYDTLGARALFANFDSAQAAGMSLDDYIGAFQALYAQGARGVTFESAQQHPQMQAVIRGMGEQAARAALEAGMNDRDILSQSQGYIRKRVRVKGKALQESGVSIEKGVHIELSEDAKTFLDLVAEKTGKNIVLTNALSDEDRGIYSDNTIYLNANKEEHVMMVTALHEAVHNMKVYAPEDYRTLEKFVFNYLAAQGKDIHKMLDSIAAVYGKDAATQQTREEELVCKTVEGLAADRDALAAALQVKGNIPLIEKIGDILKRIADRVMAFFKGDKALQQAAHNRYAHVFLEDAQALRDMAAIVSRGFDDARETEREFGKAQSAERFSKVGETEYTKYNSSIDEKDIKALQQISESKGMLSVNDFSEQELILAQKWAYKYYKDMGVKSPFYRAWFGEWRENDTKTKVKIVDIREDNSIQKGSFRIIDLGDDWIVRVSRNGIENTKSHAGSGKLSVRGLKNIKELIENSIYLDCELHEHHMNNAKVDTIAFDHKFYALGKDNNSINLYKITIEDIYQSKTKPHDLRFHNLRYITEIEKVADNINGSSSLDENQEPYTTNVDVSTTNYNIADLISYVKQYDERYKPNATSKVVDNDGKPLVVYHQTGADFTVFDTESKGAGRYDDETPNGIFLKPSDNDIGLKGKKQMALYASIKNPLSVRNREELVRYYEKNVDGYEEKKAALKHIDIEYSAKYEEASKRADEEYAAMHRKLRKKEITREEYDLFAKKEGEEERVIKEWEQAGNKASAELKALVTQFFKNSDYDGIIIEQDAGSFGRSTKTFIAFESEQVKSATDNIGTFDKNNPDIRYSKDDTIIDDWDDDQLIYTEDGDLSFDVPGKAGVIDVERLVQEQGADQAIYTLYNATVRTAEKAIKGYRGVRMDDKSYAAIAKKVMRRFDISEKHAPGMETVLADRIKAYTEAVTQGNQADFSAFMNGLATDCKRYLEHSGNYTRGAYEEDAKKLYGILRGATILISPYDESAVLDDYDGNIRRLRDSFKGYVHVGFERDRYRYKNPITIRDVVESFAAETGIDERSPYFPDGADGTAMDGWEAWNWLSQMLELFKPQFVNHYTSGDYYRSIDAAAVDMALDINAAIADEKAQRAAAMRKADRQTVKEIAEDRRQTLERQRALHKAQQLAMEQKYARLKQRYEREHGLREMAEHDRDVLKRFTASDTHNFREQYLDQQRARNDLESVRRNIAKLRTMIVNPTNEKFIPPEILHNQVFLNAVEALGEGIISNRRSAIAEKMQDMLREIKAVKGQSQQYDGDFENAFDEEFTAELQSLADWIVMDYQKTDEDGVRKITRESLDNYEISQLRQMVDEIVYRIENARKLLLRKDGMLAKEASDAVIRETRAMDKNLVKKVWAGVSEQMLNPLRTVNHMSGFNEKSELHKLFYALNEGQRKSLFWQMNAEKEFAALVDKNADAYRASCNDVLHFDYTADGKGYRIDMTRMQALQVLMTWKRESRSSMNHMRRGGIKVADYMAVRKGKGNVWENARTVPVNHELISQMIKSMGAFENAYMRTAEHYFNHTAKDAINETFMVTRHREIARSEYYIPVRVDEDMTKAESTSIKYDFRLESAGSYKHVTPGAPQPILIESLNSVIDRHIAQTGRLYGLDIPLLNFRRMFKGTTSMPGEGNFFVADSVKKALGDVFGKESVKFLEDTVNELEKGGRESDRDKFSAVADFLYKTRVKTSLVGNLGVVIKQAASYPTAGLYLSMNDLNKGLVKFAGKGLRRQYSDVINEIDKYTAQHYIRRKGMSVQEVADMMQQSKLSRKTPAVLNPVKWIQGMDCLTTAALWEATKSHIDRQYKKAGKERESAEYWKDVTSLYDTVIEDTQPMYDALHRSEFQKNKSSVRKFLFPFKTQPMQNMGILADAAAEMMTKKDASSRKKFAKAVASQITSNLVFSLMTFAAAMSRHRADRYKDDEDKYTFSSVASGVMWDMFTNGINTVLPIGGDWLESLGEDVVTNISKGKSPVESFSKLSETTQLSVLNDWHEKFSRAAKLLNNQLTGLDKKEINPWDFTWRVLDVPGSFAEFFGIPYSNLSTLFKGVGNWVKDSNMYGLVNNKGDLKTDHITDHILKAYDSGNRKKGDELTRMWLVQKKNDGISEDNAEKNINEKMAEALKVRDDVKRAYAAKNSGDLKTYRAVKDKYLGMGLSETVFDEAIHKIENAAKKEEKQKTGSEGTAQKSEYTYQNAFDALKNGDTESYALARKEIADTMVQNGKATDEKEAGDKVDKELRSLKYTKALFEAEEQAYHNDDGDGLRRVQKSLLLIYGDRTALNKARERYRKSKQKKSG
jgi:hypothetical protein